MDASEHLVRAGLFAALMVMPAVAHAQAKDPAAGQALFDEGQKAMKAGDVATACAKFADSQRADPAPGTLFFLADCEEKRGSLASAWAHFKELEQKLPPDDPRRANVIERAAALEPRVAKLTIRLAKGAPADAVVTKDGVVVGPAALGGPIPIDPGPHEIVVEATGRKKTRTTVNVAGPSTEITVAAGAPDESAAAHSGSTGGVQVPVGITLGSVGVAAMIAGIVTGVVAKGHYADSGSHCDPDDFCDETGIQIRDDARAVGLAGTVTFVIGAALAGTGLIVWLTSPRDEGGLASGRLGVGLLPGGLAVRGTW